MDYLAIILKTYEETKITKHIFCCLFLVWFMNGIYGQNTFQRSVDLGGGEEAGKIIQLADGGFIIAGDRKGSDSADIDIVVLALDSLLQLRWHKRMGGSLEDEFQRRSIIETSDGGFLIGCFSLSYTFGRNDAYIIKLDSAGSIEWSKNYGNVLNEAVVSIIELPSGGFFVSGGSIPGYTTSIDHFLFEIDASGNLQWGKLYGGPLLDGPRDMIRSNDGNFVIAGRCESYGAPGLNMSIFKVDSLGNKIFFKTYGGAYDDYASSVKELPNGDLLVAGFSELNGPGTDDIHLLKLNAQGDTIWTRNYGGQGQDIAWGLDITSQGHILICGQTTSFGGGGNDGFLLCLDSIGGVDWCKTYGSLGDEIINHFVVMPDGGFLMVGKTDSLGQDKDDLYFVRTDSLGNSGSCFEADWPIMSGWLGVTLGTGGAYATWGLEDSALTEVNIDTVRALDIDLNSNIGIINSISCAGDSDAILEPNITGGYPPYNFLWDDNTSDPIRDSVSAGTYALITSDRWGCLDTSIIVLQEPDTLVASINITQPIPCPMGQTGSLMGAAIGGTTPYSFQWFNGPNSPAFGPLGTGAYELSISDSNGCIDSTSILLQDPPPINPVISVVSPLLCFGAINGAIIVNTTNGTSPFQYFWNTGDTTMVKDSLDAGIYSVVVIDSNGCQDSTTFSLIQPPPLSLSFQSVPDAGQCNGTLTVTPNGGTLPYFYQWDSLANFQTDSVATALCTGSYCVTVSDLNGCEVDSCNIDVLTEVVEIRSHNNEFWLSPNPCTKIISVELTPGELANRIDILNLAGTQVQSLSIESVQNVGDPILIDISELRSGVYFLQVFSASNSRVLTRKFVKF